METASVESHPSPSYEGRECPSGLREPLSQNARWPERPLPGKQQGACRAPLSTEGLDMCDLGQRHIMGARPMEVPPAARGPGSPMQGEPTGAVLYSPNV